MQVRADAHNKGWSGECACTGPLTPLSKTRTRTGNLSEMVFEHALEIKRFAGTPAQEGTPRSVSTCAGILAILVCTDQHCIRCTRRDRQGRTAKRLTSKRLLEAVPRRDRRILRLIWSVPDRKTDNKSERARILVKAAQTQRQRHRSRGLGSFHHLCLPVPQALSDLLVIAPLDKKSPIMSPEKRTAA